MPGSEPDGFRAQKDTVDALEQDLAEGGAAEPADEDEDSPAFELDLDPEDQGSADAAAANPD